MHTENKIGFENTIDGQRLQRHGNMDESFDDLINRILDDWEEQEQENDK